MLKLNNIVKNYPAGDTTVHALRGVTLEFRESEFVAILGPSGCGKTTMLNIIGGLDRYTSGDLVIGGVSTKSFDAQHWDAYRNATIGFVFQSYNLIPHLTVAENVELALSLVGEKKKDRRAKAIAALDRVGMADQLNKKPNQLSGGQMQRVAIARAIVNDPKIILADEPTGALDSELSVQVMDILAEIAENRLVIMVTHNPELAKLYCNRIVRFKDGSLIEDTNPYVSTSALEEELEIVSDEDDALTAEGHFDTPFASQVEDESEEGTHEEEHKSPLEEYAPMNLADLEPKKKEHISTHKRRKTLKELNAETKAFFDQLGLNSLTKKKKKERPAGFKPTHMTPATSFGLSIKNLISKFRRTFFTSFAGSIGIIGLALVLSISNGFNKYIERMEAEQFAAIPLGVYEYNVDSNAIMRMMSSVTSLQTSDATYPEDNVLRIGKENNELEMLNKVIDAFFKGNASANDITPEFDAYMRNMPEEYYNAISVYYGTRFNLVSKYKDPNGTKDENGDIVYKYADVSQMPDATSVLTIATTVLGQKGQQPKCWNQMVGSEEEMLRHYDLLTGRYPVDNFEEGHESFEVLVCVDADNAITRSFIDTFNLDVFERDDDDKIIYENGYRKLREGTLLDDLVGQEIHLVLNDDYYRQDEYGNYVVDKYNGYVNSMMAYLSVLDPSSGGSSDYRPWYYTDEDYLKDLYENHSITLKISGVIRLKKDDLSAHVSQNALCYTPELGEWVAQMAYESQVAEYQRSLEDTVADEDGTENIFGGAIPADNNLLEAHEVLDIMGGAMHQHSSYLKAIGAVKIPLYVSVIAKEYGLKDKIGAYIDNWKNQPESESEIGYFDVGEMTLANLNTIVNLVSLILIAVASISLVVSTVMIGVITANSVVERTREIGILRSLGARKADIRNVFVAETTILGLWSGVLGVVITYILCPIISAIIGAFSGIGGLLMLNPWHAVVLIALSLVLTVISGVIPAIGASRKNVVEALRVD